VAADVGSAGWCATLNDAAIASNRFFHALRSSHRTLYQPILFLPVTQHTSE